MADRTSTITLAVRDAYSVNVQAFAKALQAAEGQTTKLSAAMKAWQSANAGAKDMLMGMGVALPVSPMMAFGQALSFTIDRALEAEKVAFATNAVLKSTGDVSGYSSGEISKMADKFSMLTGVDDEVIQSAENVMLTFTAIGHDKFPAAMTAAQNLSAALGQDLQSSVIQVGKALQDPILGLTALRRVGVNFNEAAKETVKHLMDIGDQAGAQKFILDELNKEFGGMAEAMGDTAQGKMNKFKIAIENVGEAIGNRLIPVLGKAADAALLLLNGSQQLTDLFVAHSEEVLNTSKTYKDYVVEIVRSAKLTGDLGQEVKGAELNLYNNRKAAGIATDGYTELDGVVYKATENFKLYSEAQYNVIRGTGESTIAMSGYIHATSQAKPVIDSTTDAANGLSDALKAQGEAWSNQFAVEQRITEENKNFSSKQADLTQKVQEYRAELDKLQKTQGQVIAIQHKGKGNAEEVYAAQLKLVAVQKEYNRVVANAKPGDIVHADHVAKLRNELDKLNEVIGYNTTATVDNKAKIKDLNDKLAEAEQAVNDNATAHDEATKRIVFDFAMQRLAVDGFAPYEIAALQKISDQFGFTSDSSEAMALRVIDATNQLAIDQNPDTFAKNISLAAGVVIGSLQGASSEAVILHNKIAALQSKEIYVRTIYEDVYLESHGHSNQGVVPPGTGSSPAPSRSPAPAPAPTRPPTTGRRRATGGPVYPGNSYTVGENGLENLSIGANGVGYVTPLNDNRNQSKVTINVYTSQPVTPQNLALMRAQAGAY